MNTTLTVNNKIYNTPAQPDTALLYVLRNDFELNGAKYGCGAGQCGACTVLIDGAPIRSCVTPISSLRPGTKITTIEGALALQDKGSKILGILQHAFIQEQAAQCGYCINGIIMTAVGLLDKNSAPSEAQIREALAANLCRCGTHSRIIKAVQRAASQLHTVSTTSRATPSVTSSSESGAKATTPVQPFHSAHTSAPLPTRAPVHESAQTVARLGL